MTDPACWSWPVPIGPMPNHLGSVSIWQAGRCAVCGNVARLYEDHDHGPGRLTRGYLCPSCNVGEGCSSSVVFRRYRERPPAALLGVRVRYRTQVGHPDDQAARNRWDVALESLAAHDHAVELHLMRQRFGHVEPAPELVCKPLMVAAVRVGLTQAEWFDRAR